MDIETYNEKFLKEFNEKILVQFRRAELIPTYEKTSKCPKCGADAKLDLEHMELYCTECGYITKASIYYVGGCRIEYPYGILL